MFCYVRTDRSRSARRLTDQYVGSVEKASDDFIGSQSASSSLDALVASFFGGKFDVLPGGRIWQIFT